LNVIAVMENGVRNMEATWKTTRQRARNQYTVLTVVSQHKYHAIQTKRCFFSV